MNAHWTRAQIRTARQRPLKPVLESLGYRLAARRDGNYEVIGMAAEVMIKDHYWVRSEDGAAGNAIDFFVKIEGKSFNNAMQLLAG
jgi:hypothetical protein